MKPNFVDNFSKYVTRSVTLLKKRKIRFTVYDIQGKLYLSQDP